MDGRRLKATKTIPRTRAEAELNGEWDDKLDEESEAESDVKSEAEWPDDFDISLCMVFNLSR